MKHIKYSGLFILLSILTVVITACSSQQEVVRGAAGPTVTESAQLNLPAQDQLVGSASEAGICKENSDDCATEARPTPDSQKNEPTPEVINAEITIDPTVDA